VLEKVIAIDNVGIFKKGATKAVALDKIALIYADNARGKSTLSSLLLACAGADVKDVVGRKTVGTAGGQKVLLRFDPADGSGAFNAEFDGATWRGARPNLHVFNQAFVDRNVFASSGVLPAHREALMTLALGDAAVAERQKFDEQSAAQRECATRVTAAEGALQGFRGGFTVDQYLALPQIADVDEQIAAIDRQATEVRAADSIRQRAVFRELAEPTIDLDAVAEVLQTSFSTAALAAEQRVKAHLARHGRKDMQRWVAEGLELSQDEACPFCGQSTKELALLAAYREYFDAAYSSHMRAVSGLRGLVSSALKPSLPSSWRDTIQFNAGVYQGWTDAVDATGVPAIDLPTLEASFEEMRGRILHIVEQKERRPLNAIDASVLAHEVQEWRRVIEIYVDYNAKIQQINQAIATYKNGLTANNIVALTAARGRLTASQSRYAAATLILIEGLRVARAAFKAAELAKDQARAELDKLMASTLASFQGAINEWLRRFGAPFQVAELDSTYIGGSLRSEYVLKMRGATVKVGPGAAGELSFQAALSEGDKRTLAFAFFLARLFADPNRKLATVVLDDVFTSLDKHRRQSTIDAVLRMVDECAQVVALAHDAHFLRDIKKRVTKKKLGTAIELELARDADDYSTIESFDLDGYCASEYYKHYSLVERFVSADRSASLIEVAKALRLLIEGHLHRCFPEKFADGLTVGDMLGLVKQAMPPSPLVKLQAVHGDLVAFNDYAATFHHDTSGGYTRTEVNATELLTFAKQALDFIHVRQMRPA
jgi:wobble nucleotide-excising tRNase